MDGQTIDSRTGRERTADTPAPARTAPAVAGHPALCVAKGRRVSDFLALDAAREAGRRVQAGEDIARLEIGQPSAPAPRLAREAARHALANDVLGYTDALGTRPLRERIARHYDERYGLTVSPDRVVVTNGSSGGFLLSFLSLFDQGARVGMAVPGYPAYSNILSALEIEPVGLSVGPDTRWSLEARHVTPDLDGLLLASPANPTGIMTPPETLAGIAAAAARNGVRLISDELYHGLEYGAPAETMLRFTDDAIVVNSFSKYYCMTGWRLGWLVVPDALVRPMERLAQSLYISVPTLSQAAAVAAFDAGEELEANKAVYVRNRLALLDALPGFGLDPLPADGAFYLWADVSRFGLASPDFAARALDAGVSITPGLDFDPARGGDYIRLSFAGSAETIDKAVDRLGRFLPMLG